MKEQKTVTMTEEKGQLSGRLWLFVLIQLNSSLCSASLQSGFTKKAPPGDPVVLLVISLHMWAKKPEEGKQQVMLKVFSTSMVKFILRQN